MTILNYHGFRDWAVRKDVNEDLKRSFTFGFELEVTLNDDSNMVTPTMLSNKIKSKFGKLFVCERDSSIGNGVEIISQPMTWKWFMNHLDTFKELLNLCVESGFDSHTGDLCGLYVHIGREALCGFDNNNRSLNQDFVITNINYIMERYQNELFKFSRRTLNSYRHWCSSRTDLIDLNGHKFIDKERIGEASNDITDRYYSLNLCNEKTIEFRFLRGTLKWETFFISLNLLKNIVENSRKSSHVITLEDLIFNGLDDNFKKYAIDYCKKRKITDEESDWKKPLFLEKTNSESLSNIFQFNELDLANDILNDE